jgi:hypothetical protein
MGQSGLSLLIDGFTFYDVMLMTAAALVAALAMRRWNQLTAAALIAYAVDVLARFAVEYLAAGDVPANFAVDLALARLDMHGLAATVRPLIYFGAIAFLFGLKHRFGAR